MAADPGGRDLEALAARDGGVRSSGFTVKLPGGAEISVQQATDEERALFGDLAERVADQGTAIQRLEARIEEGAQRALPSPSPEPDEPTSTREERRPRQVRRLLVYGEPLTQSEIALLFQEGVHVFEVPDLSAVADAPPALTPYDALVTDPGQSAGEKSPGFRLIEALRDRGDETPVFMMQRQPAGYGNWTKSVREAGGSGFAADLLGLDSAMRVVGLTLFRNPRDEFKAEFEEMSPE